MRRRGLSVPIFRRNRVTAMDRDALPIRKRDNFGYRAKWNASRRISNSTGRVSPSTLVPFTVLSSSRVLFSFVFVLLPANVTGVKLEFASTRGNGNLQGSRIHRTEQWLVGVLRYFWWIRLVEGVTWVVRSKGTFDFFHLFDIAWFASGHNDGFKIIELFLLSFFVSKMDTIFNNFYVNNYDFLSFITCRKI